MRIKIKQVDHNGLNGRERPPQNADIGLEGIVIGVENVCHDGEIANAVADVFSGDPDAYVLAVFTCLMSDDRILEISEDEMEVVK